MSDLSTSQGTTGSTSTGDTAREESQRTAEHAKSEARDVQSSAKQEASQVASEAKRQARGLVDDAKGQLQGQARDLTDRVAQFANSFANDARALVDGRTDESGAVGDYARSATDQVERFAQRVDELGFDGVVDEVGRFARRRPGAFLLGAAAAGFAVARLGRGARDEQQSTSGDGSATTGRTGVASGTVTGGSAVADPDAYGEPGLEADVVVVETPAAGEGATDDPLTTPRSGEADQRGEPGYRS